MRSHEASTHGNTRYLPQSLIATAAVTMIPLVAIWGLRSAGIATSPLVCIALAVMISLAVSALGSAYWKRRRPASELLFSELMLWSWIRHRRSEHTLSDAGKLLKDVELSPERREHLLRQVVSSIEAQDPYTVGHSHRVARHSVMVARKLGLPSEEKRALRAAAAIHDVGKLRVAPEILHKPGLLNDTEYELIKHHSTDGAELVSALGDERLTAIVRHHHERLDGTGYPAGLAGEEIPLGARIVAVADTFDAITSARPYRPARAHKQALEILRNEAGRQLDGRVVDAFIACYAGRRAVAAWATLSSLPQATVARLAPGTHGPGLTRFSPQSALGGTVTVAVVAGVAIAAPIPARHHRHVRTPLAPRVLAAAPVLGAKTVRATHRPHARRPARSSPFSPVLTVPAPPTPAPSVHRQLAVAHTPLVNPGRPTGRTPAPHPSPVTPMPPPTTFPPTPPPTTTTTPTTPPALPAAPPSPVTTTTTTTTATTVSPVSTTTTTSTTTTSSSSTTSTTTTTTTSTTGDRCKNGGYVPLGYRHQGDCESSGHRHHGGHDH